MKYRYRNEDEMKDSGVEWIGNIPVNYIFQPLKKFFDFEKGKNAGRYTAEYIAENKGGFPVYSGQTENDGIMGLIDSYEYDLDECLFTTTVGAKVMTVAYLQGKFTLSQNCLIMINKNLNVYSKYVYYYLQELFRYQISTIPTYMQPSLRIEDLKKYRILTPDMKEQEKIAKFLDEKTSEFDSIISKKEALIQKLKEAKKSLISEVVTGKVKVVKTDEGYELVERKKEDMKDSGVEWVKLIPNEWNLKRSNYVFKFSKGLSITKENLQDEGIPCINYGEIHSKYGFEVNPKKHKLKCVSKEYIKSNSNALIKYGDFIFADTSEDIKGCGNFSYLNSEDRIFAGYHTVIARTLENISSRYLAYLFDSDDWRSQIRTKVSGIKVFSITQSILKKTEVILPILEEQKLIVDYLDNKFLSIDSMINSMKRQIEKLKEAKQSLISEAVTGKIEIL